MSADRGARPRPAGAPSDAWIRRGRATATQKPAVRNSRTWTREAGAPSTEGGIHEGPQPALRERPPGGAADPGGRRGRGRGPGGRRRDRGGGRGQPPRRRDGGAGRLLVLDSGGPRVEHAQLGHEQLELVQAVR